MNTQYVVGRDNTVLLVVNNSYDESTDKRFQAVVLKKGKETSLAVGYQGSHFDTDLWQPGTIVLGITKIPTFAEKCADLGTDTLAEAYNILWRANSACHDYPRSMRATELKRILTGTSKYAVHFEDWYKLITFLQKKLDELYSIGVPK